MGSQTPSSRATHMHQSKQHASTRADLREQGDMNTITIRVGNEFDGSASAVFRNVIEQAQHEVGTVIVVDMANTQRIFDSGLELLKMLDKRSWRRTTKIRIINCSPDMERRITHGLPTGTFNLSGDCIMLETPH